MSKICYLYNFRRQKNTFYRYSPETEHVASNLGGALAEIVITHSAPISAVIYLQSSFVAKSTSSQPHVYT